MRLKADFVQRPQFFKRELIGITVSGWNDRVCGCSDRQAARPGYGARLTRGLRRV